MQVADRWHLLKNLREAIERLLARHHCELKAVSHALIPTSPPPSRLTTPPAPAPALVPSVSRRARLREARRQHRRERYEQVLAWHQQGKSVSFIAHELRMCRGTVRRHLRAGQFRERAPRTVPPGKLAPFHAFLKSRWEAGCHSAAALWRELKAQGFSGSPILVRRAVQPWRTELAAAQAPEDTAHIQVPSPSRASWWLLALAPESDTQTQAAHQRFVKALVEHCPDLATAQTLAMPFVDMIRHHQADQFDHWLTQIHHSDVPELQGFARGVLNDKAAVIAGLTSPWSSGQVEGQVNRLKGLKREMYGRASFPLLKARVLHPP